jgi:hypothetical protein
LLLLLVVLLLLLLLLLLLPTLCPRTRTCVCPCCCLLPVDDNGFIVVTVKAEVVRGAGRHQLRQVTQVHNGGAVDGQDLVSSETTGGNMKEATRRDSSRDGALSNASLALDPVQYTQVQCGVRDRGSKTCGPRTTSRCACRQ